jgi:hypothetical protein
LIKGSLKTEHAQRGVAAIVGIFDKLTSAGPWSVINEAHFGNIRQRIRAMLASPVLQQLRLDRRRLLEDFRNSDACFGLVAYHRAIWTGADHLYAGQLELHQKYLEPLATVWTVIT